jgi:hypothetical protein
LAGSAVVCPCHVCAFYSGADERDAALIPFIKEGLEAGERALLFVDGPERLNRIDRLRRGGIDVETALWNGHLEVEAWEDVQLRGGRFDPAQMREAIQDTINAGHLRGFPRTRIWADMEWALTGAPGVEQLAVFESRLNLVLPLYSEAAVCAYDTSRFPASLLEDVSRAHPYLLADGATRRNPDYVPPEKLVPELESRRS